ncbi:phage tail protein [Campylobacter sp. RM16192]|uniref:phage tail protein n=1 Tax=Campylobacter sp. RM16192 TaxID=1660080 RepID=UPI0014515BCF|nr:phage tail protein [Campylobacter sp. RM16192]QCD52227.1 phage P2 GpU family protein [Campylobacter sp. RM16192]
MVLNLGGFKFDWMQTDSISKESEFGISSNDRINNYPLLFRANLGSQTITISGKTLPYSKDRQTGLKRLYELANEATSYPLTNGAGKYFGRFVIIKISETRSIFTKEGLFISQSFSVELRRDHDYI